MNTCYRTNRKILALLLPFVSYSCWATFCVDVKPFFKIEFYQSTLSFSFSFTLYLFIYFARRSIIYERMRTAIVALSALACASTSLAFMPVTMQAQPKAGQLGKQKSAATLSSSAPRLGLPSLQAATSSFFDILPKGLDFSPKSPSVGLKKTVVVTGASSGLGKATVKALANRGGYFIICAVRDVEKMKQVAQELGLENGSYKIMELNVSNGLS